MPRQVIKEEPCWVVCTHRDVTDACRTSWSETRRANCVRCWRSTTRCRTASCVAGTTWTICLTTRSAPTNSTSTRPTANCFSPSRLWTPPRTERRWSRYAYPERRNISWCTVVWGCTGQVSIWNYGSPHFSMDSHERTVQYYIEPIFEFVLLYTKCRQITDNCNSRLYKLKH